jgi:hypothetical protein
MQRAPGVEATRTIGVDSTTLEANAVMSRLSVATRARLT